MSNIHILLPALFPEPAAAPLRDAFTTSASIVAQTIMCKRKLDCWYLWIAVDLVAFIYYFQVGVALIGIEYIIFGIIATFGLIGWRKELKGDVATCGTVSA
jgi:nicotinamide mononucleotide transporter